MTGSHSYRVSDLERVVFGSDTGSRGKRQRAIRRYLREIGLGVGSGHHYEFEQEEFGWLAAFAKDRFGTLGELPQ